MQFSLKRLLLSVGFFGGLFSLFQLPSPASEITIFLVVIALTSLACVGVGCGGLDCRAFSLGALPPLGVSLLYVTSVRLQMLLDQCAGPPISRGITIGLIDHPTRYFMAAAIVFSFVLGCVCVITRRSFRDHLSND